MKVASAHASVTTNTNAGARVALILTECAGLGPPLAVWHLKQCRKGQFVNLGMKTQAIHITKLSNIMTQYKLSHQCAELLYINIKS